MNNRKSKIVLPITDYRIPNTISVSPVLTDCFVASLLAKMAWLAMFVVFCYRILNTEY